MKYFKYLSLLIILSIIGITVSCERDDICPESTPTTPKLIIDLFDDSNRENKKNVIDIVVIDADADLVINSESILTGYNFQDTNNLILPLKTTKDTTQYRLINQAKTDNNGTPDDTSDDKIIGGNTDIITISYTREQVYVSRACGFKTIFKNVILTVVEDDDEWIISSRYATDNQSVEDETTTHFNIFH
ncbi:hypothetical protein A8C32_04415 [Flavivirga aquatica]|uniref:Uncharacterized protein n=1 Tax=Flavivirga aquatica TaxID=1849968 RepID=A0A1E5SH71_9FLAO|nr:DUF6452 family protein [Flavivirga aquatica]OEJ98463.1 hypothetical protein A8C32_04415 [Flavivirga aquatica]